MKDKLINEIVECLKIKNRDRDYNGNRRLDIPFMIAALDQHLTNKEYEDLLYDLERYDYGIQYIEENPEDYYSDGSIRIQLAEKNCEDNKYEYYVDRMLDYEYKIDFLHDERYCGYCECEEGYEDYDARYRCCGHGCDWTAPAFSISKIIHIGYNSFDGDEHDFWDYKDKFNNVTQKDKEEAEKRSKIRRLQEEKERIERELESLSK
ncbi:hypothetical protein [Clostridium cuniculi]|uniref:hypothetical protein n=1 Tax=Clostridium cuniculi TaxID=2548455 RepID=UPI0010541A0A|nr:hypothetical protein [Clostridium cuniculi]